MPRYSKQRRAAIARGNRQKLTTIAPELDPTTWMLIAVETEKPDPEQDPPTEETLNSPDSNDSSSSERDSTSPESDATPVQSPPKEVEPQSCLFCLRTTGFIPVEVDLFQKIEFVLMARLSFAKLPCCTSCGQMFELFYDFKKNCLSTMAKRDELLKAKSVEKLEEKVVEPAIEQPPPVKEVEMKVVEPSKPVEVSPKQPSNKVFACTMCPITFMNEEEFGFHKNKHLGVKPYKCQLGCGKAFPNPKECFIHEVLCAAAPPKDCDVCGLSFPTENELLAHKVIHLKPQFECPRCGEEFFFKHDCKKHVETCEFEAEDPLKDASGCEDSAFRIHIPKLSELHEVEEAEQESVVESLTPVEESRKGFECSACPESFEDEVEHGYHMNVHNGVNPYKCRIIGCKEAFPSPKMCFKHETTCALAPKECEICEMSFTTASQLKSHQKRKHSELCPEASPKAIITKINKSFCPHCQAAFLNKRDCENHASVCQSKSETPPKVTNQSEQDSDIDDTRESPPVRSCRHCGLSFPANYTFIRHQQKCGPQRPHFRCPRCPKGFFLKSTLEAHLKRHDGVAPYPCQKPNCERTFFDDYARDRHEEGCGTLGFVCDICGKACSTMPSLKIHRRKHDGPKIPCNQCKKLFHTKASLQKHMTVHSGERRFGCEVCGKKFKSAEANRVHQRIHTDAKPYACPECGERFRYNCSVKAHLDKKACIIR